MCINPMGRGNFENPNGRCMSPHLCKKRKDGPPTGIPCVALVPGQGYWASPAYWEYVNGSTTNYMLYYSATTQDTNPGVPPLPLNGYQLLTGGTSGPIPTTYLSTTALFCYHSPTPSVSSNGTAAGTGIVWAIEHPNKHNPTDCAGAEVPHAALHAFNAVTLAPLYSSGNVATPIGGMTSFSTPTIFNGQVYVGTKTEVDVFGLCPSDGPSGCLR